jgi:hypothetical protein
LQGYSAREDYLARGGWRNRRTCLLLNKYPQYGARENGPQPHESISDSIIDILLDRGQRCDDRQLALAISTSHAYFFDLAYAVRKLRQIGAKETPVVREAAKKELEDLSYSWPQIREGWPEHCA